MCSVIGVDDLKMISRGCFVIIFVSSCIDSSHSLAAVVFLITYTANLVCLASKYPISNDFYSCSTLLDQIK